MGLIKSMIKIGVAGAVAGSVINSAIKESHKTAQERTDEKILWSKNKYDYKKILNINPKKIKEVYKFLIKNAEKSDFVINKDDKLNSFSFTKGNIWIGGKQTVSFNLEKANNKILFTTKVEWHFGCIPEGKDYREFMEESEAMANILEQVFLDNSKRKSKNKKLSCLKCNSSIKKIDKFCRKCGEKI